MNFLSSAGSSEAIGMDLDSIFTSQIYDKDRGNSKMNIKQAIFLSNKISYDNFLVCLGYCQSFLVLKGF